MLFRRQTFRKKFFFQLFYSRKKVVYVSGEETAQQIVSRSQRLSMKTEDIFLLCDTNLDRIIDRTINGMDDAPALMIVDSIQTMQCADNENIMGGITQIRQCAAKLLQLAKSTGTVGNFDSLNKYFYRINILLFYAEIFLIVNKI